MFETGMGTEFVALSHEQFYEMQRQAQEAERREKAKRTMIGLGIVTVVALGGYLIWRSHG